MHARVFIAFPRVPGFHHHHEQGCRRHAPRCVGVLGERAVRNIEQENVDRALQESAKEAADHATIERVKARSLDEANYTNILSSFSPAQKDAFLAKLASEMDDASFDKVIEVMSRMVKPAAAPAAARQRVAPGGAIRVDAPAATAAKEAGERDQKHAAAAADAPQKQ